MNTFNYYSSHYRWELFKAFYRYKYRMLLMLKHFLNTSLLMVLMLFCHLSQAETYFSLMSNESGGTPVGNGQYTNQAPQWKWQNSYQIDIQDAKGNTVYGEVIGDINHFTFSKGLVHGNSYKARIRNSIDNGVTWGAWSEHSSLITVDTVKPTVTLDSFSRTLANAAKVTFTAEDNLSGLANAHLQISDNRDFTSLIFDQTIPVANSSYTVTSLPASGVLYARIKVADKASNESDYTAPMGIAINIPTIIQPINSSVIRKSGLVVSGIAEASGKVKLYLNNELIDKTIIVDDEGNFDTEIALVTEGNYQLAATVENGSEVSELSSLINFTYALPAPKAIFVTPAENLELTTSVDIEVSAIDEVGVSKVEFFVDGTLLATVTEIPYLVHWDITAGQNGPHTLKAVVTNTSGKVVEVTRQVTVKVEALAPPPTIYTGQVSTISPELTYGLQPITITGKGVYRTDDKSVANAPLKLVLMTNGFERKINVVTDAEGNFSYVFAPQESDAGVYQVAIIHPNETQITPQGGFVINRIKFNLAGYNLKTVHNLTNEIKVTAKVSADTTGLRWVARAEDQTSGSLPKGIQLEGGTGINIAASNTATTVIKFTADNTAPEKGTIHLVALAKDSGDLVRGKLQLNYQLGEAKASIYATPTYIQTGIQQESTLTESITLGNRGLVPAENVVVTLVDGQGNPAPSWIFIASDSDIGALAVDETIPVQVMIQPDSSVADGIYHFNLVVASSNSTGGTISVVVSVTQHGQGTVRFDVADIYTATLDENGDSILGVKDVTIKLQNEAVLTEEYKLTTDHKGIALLGELPPGVYRYRASATNHMDASGRVVIRPNATANEHIFLEYQTINIEFGVTETTIQDEYEVEVNATFNTQVPAPVVILEPLAINLAGMLPGEEKTGQITIANYGLVQAENMVLNLPKTDSQFKYEFFGEVPSVLLPKTRIVIPYKVTALKNMEINKKALIKTLNLKRDADDDCSSYYAGFSVQYSSDCANGDTSNGSISGSFYKVIGRCQGAGIGGAWGSGGTGGFGSGSWISGGGLGTPSAIPMTAGCMPDASGGGGGASSGEGGDCE